MSIVTTTNCDGPNCTKSAPNYYKDNWMHIELRQNTLLEGGIYTHSDKHYDFCTYHCLSEFAGVLSTERQEI